MPFSQVRISLGTASVLGLLSVRISEVPTAAYLMTHSDVSCVANCSFCTQARESKASREFLSRVSWTTFDLIDVAKALPRFRALRRVCIQTIVYRGVLKDVVRMAKTISRYTDLPISVAIHPHAIGAIEILRKAGIERVGIGLDAASPSTFRRVKGTGVKGPFSWEKAMRMIDVAVKILGKGFVTCHLIYGIGDSDKEFLELVEKLYWKGVCASVFAFTPMRGTAMENEAPPPISRYRALQLAHYLITSGKASTQDLVFEEGALVGINIDRKTVKRSVQSGAPFVTRGCPGCNRPFYNETVGGPWYNYPSIRWALGDLGSIKEQLRSALRG